MQKVVEWRLDVDLKAHRAFSSQTNVILALATHTTTLPARNSALLTT